jgi:hypothetical protein
MCQAATAGLPEHRYIRQAHHRWLLDPAPGPAALVRSTGFTLAADRPA